MLSWTRYIPLLAIVLSGAFRAAAQLPMPDTVCVGTGKSYWVDSTANPGCIYTWAIDGTVVQSGTTCVFAHTWNFEGTFELTLRQVSAQGCAGELQTGQAIVDSALPASVSIAANMNNVCTGTTVILTATPVNGGTAPVFAWYVNDTIVPGESTAAYAYIPANGDEVYVMLLSGPDNAASIPANSDTVKITVSPLTTPALSITNPASICTPKTANLRDPAITSGSSAGLTFTYWMDPAATIPVSDATAVGEGVYYIKGQASANCFDIQPVSVITIPSAGDPDPITILSGTEPICQMTDGTTTTTYLSAAVKGIITYSVLPAGTGTIASTTGIITWAEGFSGTATIFASTTGCDGTKTTERTVTITPTAGIPVFTKGSVSSRSPASETITYTATSTNSSGISYSLDDASLAGGNTIHSVTGDVTFAANWAETSVITATAEGCNGPATATHLVTVDKTGPAILWSNPADIIYGTTISDVQLNATAGVPGSLVYIPVAGTLLNAEPNQILSVNFKPDDSSKYYSANAWVKINVVPKLIVVQAVANTKVYDGTTSASLLTRSFTGVIAPDIVSCTGGTAEFDTPSAGTGKKVIVTGFFLTGPDAGNYQADLTTATTADITPLAAPTTLAVNTTSFGHLSDLITLTATIHGGAPLAGGSPAASSVTFTFEGNVMKEAGSNSNIVLAESGSNLVASLTLSILEITPGGSMTSGVKEVVATFTDESKNYSVGPNPATATFTFAPGCDIRIYPNPLYGPDLKFQLTLPVSSHVIIDLFASNGQLISRIFEGYISGGESKTIRYSHTLSQGIYLYQIRTDNQNINGRIIVIRVY